MKSNFFWWQWQHIIWPVAQLLSHTIPCYAKWYFRTFSSNGWGFVGNIKHCITRNTSFSGFETYLLICMEKKSIAPQSWGHQILFVSISHVIYKNHLTKCKISLLVFFVVVQGNIQNNVVFMGFLVFNYYKKMDTITKM